MNNSNTVCPVCTLYLREGVTLQAHLSTHPKDQVIEALLKVSDKGSSAEIPPASTTSAESFEPVQSFTNSNTPFLPQPCPYINPPSQLTTAVTYQHFMTSNGSTIMPQYIQIPAIINPTTNIPVISNQAVDFASNQTMNYSQTMYNPLYNPYIPHPYPFTQPVYTNFPSSNVPTADATTQSNPISTLSASTTAKAGTSQAVTTKEPSIVIEKCSVATSTESNKKISTNNGGRKTYSRFSTIKKKIRFFKLKTNDSSNSRVIYKPIVKSTGKVTKVGSSKKSVIKTLRTNNVSEISTNTRKEAISPPPLASDSETTKISITESKTPSPLPTEKLSCFDSDTLQYTMKDEDTIDCAAAELVSVSINDSPTNDDEVVYLEQDQKPNSVIVDSSTFTQSSNNESKSNIQSKFEVQPKSTILETAEESIQKVSRSIVDKLIIKSVDTNIDDEVRKHLEEDETEKQEKVFQMLEIEEERKIAFSDVTINQDISKELNDSNIEKNCERSDIFTQQKNIRFNRDSEKEKHLEFVTYPEFVQPDIKNSENELQRCQYRFCSKEMNDYRTNSIHRKEDCIGLSKYSELKAVTYTDLQPVKTTKPYQEVSLPNPHNAKKVEGMKIIFNNGISSTIPVDTSIKLKTGVQGNNKNISNFMKTENQVTRHAISDSVIQLVSGNNEAKNELTVSESYKPTTSQTNDIQADVQNLSPLALNIQADESMPARGELSEQESLGAENSTWSIFHRNNVSKPKTAEEWRNDIAQSVSIVGAKKAAKSFKCSTCGEVFSCPKERRVHKNNVHLNKTNKLSVAKLKKLYSCGFCSEVFPCLRNRRAHIVEKHPRNLKTKKSNNNKIKKENSEIECIEIKETEPPIKNIIAQQLKQQPKQQPQQQQQPFKTETSLSSGDIDPQRVKYCSRCSLPFVGTKKLREHLRLVHGEIRFKCETCSECFDEELEYNEHLLIHPLVCGKCGKTFHKKPNLNLHMKRHLEVKPYECNLCPKSFITRQKLEEHLNGHSGKKPLKCAHCDKTFSRHSNLIQHRNLHHLKVKKKIKDFVCRCGEVFHSLRKLEWHKEIHEPKPKPCPFCSQKFIHSASVTRHIRRAHLPDYLPGDNREYDNVQCPICEKVYLRSSLVVHMRVHNGEKPFSCKICNKRFSTKWNLELHSWTHQSRSNMPFKCQICKSAFFRETDFVAHINSHRNYKPFTCNVCGQKFIRKYSWLRHQEEHKKSKQFVCAVNGCAKSFHRGYYLRDHMKVHTGVRPHTCHICGKASSTKSNHNKHVRIHDTREPVNTEN